MFTCAFYYHFQKTFTGIREPIPHDAGGVKFSLFPGFMDPDKKVMVKLSDTNEVHVFEQETGTWNVYKQDLDENSDLDLNGIGVDYKKIGVSYNERYSRSAAVQSSVSVIAGHGHCVFMYKFDRRAFFFKLVLDHLARTFR